MPVALVESRVIASASASAGRAESSLRLLRAMATGVRKTPSWQVKAMLLKLLGGDRGPWPDGSHHVRRGRKIDRLQLTTVARVANRAASVTR